MSLEDRHRGLPVKDLNHLRVISKNRGSVTGYSGIFRNRPLPAAVVLHFQGVHILHLFDTGLYEYLK